MEQRFVTTFCTDLKLQNHSHNSVVKEDFISAGLVEISDNINEKRLADIAIHLNSNFFGNLPITEYLQNVCPEEGRMEVIKNGRAKLQKKYSIDKTD